MDQVAPSVYVQPYASGNVGAISTTEGIICVDAPMQPSDIRDWRARISSLSPKPIIALIQTDYDQVRVVGPPFFDVPLIAHDATCDRIKIYGSEKTLQQINALIKADGGKGRWRARMPDITFSEELILHKGRTEIRVRHAGGHTCATSMVYLPEHKTAFVGDLVFCKQHPSMTYAETQQWLDALKRLQKMPLTKIVPGHGPVCDHTATRPLSIYIARMRERVRQSFDAGKSKSETSAAIIAEFLEAFPYDESTRDEARLRTKGGSDRIYDEYRALAKANATRNRDSTKKSRSKRSKRR
jgi:cyclase